MTRSSPFALWPVLAALSLALPLAVQPAHASGDGHGAPERKPAEKAAPKEAPAAPAASGDSMEVLRQKLAERLGATKSPENKSGAVMRVPNKAEGGGGGGGSGGGSGHGGAPKAAAAAKPAAVPEPGHDHAAHWAYGGETGPESWGKMKPEFKTCAIGQRQSPIDIRGGIQVQLPAIQFDYHTSGFSVIDNGHTVQVNLPAGNAITVNGRRYDLLQFHFHRPSEERVNGKQFDMVAHLVHKDPEGRLAVVAVLLERGSAQGVIQAVWNSLPLEKGEELASPVAIDLNQLLPEDKRYYTYMGSLTTPPCSEGVLWLVMKQPVQLSLDQIGIFARLYPMNARPIQPNSGRLIKDSN
ncbi:carbonic anhydrase [Ideonella margarita]|uniref:carbonic anhydrase n=1 Tax=Ideonella margarita TaxID=2984191 RepID=A0ABU9C0F8_9BURK